MRQRAVMTACELGITTQAIANNFAPLLFVIFREDYGISYSFIANLMLLNFAVQLITDCFSVKIINALGYKYAGVSAQLCAAAGLMFLSILPRLVQTEIALVISVIFYAFGGGLLEVLVSPIADTLGDGTKTARMSMLHSFCCWGQLAVVLITTLMIKFCGNGIWHMLALGWAAVPMANTVIFLSVSLPEPDAEKTETPCTLLKTRRFFMMCVLMICAGASEMTMAQWASLFAQNGLGVSKLWGDLLGPCMFALFMGSGRLLFGIFGGKLNLHRSLVICGIMCAACYITAAVSPNKTAALTGCAFTGFFVSIMWPGVYSYSSHAIPCGGTAMFGILALFGDIGCSLGTWLCGAVSDASGKTSAVLRLAENLHISCESLGLRIGIGIAAVFPAAMIAILMVLRKELK